MKHFKKQKAWALYDSNGKLVEIDVFKYNIPDAGRGETVARVTVGE